MRDRLTIGRRALGATTLVLCAIVALSPAAFASTPWRTTLVHQDALVTLDHNGRSSVAVALQTGGRNGDETTLDVDLYRPVTTRGGLQSIIDGQGESVPPITSTGAFPLSCRKDGVARFRLTIGARAGVAIPTCGGAQPYLDLHCRSTGCDAVYPIALRATRGSRSSTTWTLLTVSPRSSSNPLNLSLLFTSNPVNATALRLETASLHTLGKYDADTFTVGLNYLGQVTVAGDTGPSGDAYRRAMRDAVHSGHHELVNAPPASVDFASLVRYGLDAEALAQARFATRLASHYLDKRRSDPVVLSGSVTPGDIRALGTVNVDHVVVPESSLKFAPSSTLSWGTPFYVVHGTTNVLSMSTDSPLHHLMQNTKMSPGLKATLVIGSLGLLHYQAPFASQPRVAIANVDLSNVGAKFLSDLFGQLHHDPLVRLTDLAKRFSPHLVGANGYPPIRQMAHSAAPRWSGANVSAATTLANNLRGLSESTSSITPIIPLQRDDLLAETRTSNGQRSHLLSAATNALDSELSKFSIDTTSITLTSASSHLPVTITSHANYTLNGFLSLSATDVYFPQGSVIPITVHPNTTAIRVPAVVRGPGSFTLVVRVLTVDRTLAVAHGAIPVHSTATSALGILLTVAALLTIGLWWWRTTRKSTRGRHAK